jgi:DNA-binding NarL/FixJ family response regulator
MIRKTRVFLVDDHPVIQHGIAQLVAKEKDLEVCGVAGDRREALDALTGDPPDIIILDIGLKDSNRSGLDLIPEIHRHAGPVPILIYSMHDEKIYAERALRAGARGYLMKQEPVRRIVEAIHAVLKNGFYVSEEMNRRILLKQIGTFRGQQAPLTPEDRLSKREFEVFRLIGKGLKPLEIAKAICLSPKTVETHRMNIRKKFGLARASELTRFAVEWTRMSE